MTTHDDAFSMIVEMLRRSSTDSPSFPPTELYSEGWMLRLLMEAASAGHGGLPVEMLDGATWYSEALLSSAFRHRTRSDPLAERPTHADGIVGHFSFRAGTRAGVYLTDNARQFVVLEAKLNSKLAAGTSKVPWFDQAARNVAAMAWALYESGRAAESIDSLGFFVIAPMRRIAEEPTFAEYISKESIRRKVERRVELYADDPPASSRLTSFLTDTFAPMLERLSLDVVSWESLLDTVGTSLQPSLSAFYHDCLRFA